MILPSRSTTRSSRSPEHDATTPLSSTFLSLLFIRLMTRVIGSTVRRSRRARLSRYQPLAGGGENSPLPVLLQVTFEEACWGCDPLYMVMLSLLPCAFKIGGGHLHTGTSMDAGELHAVILMRRHGHSLMCEASCQITYCDIDEQVDGCDLC